MKILSLFNGISCGRLALERAGIKVDRYVSYEIDKYANTVAQKNYPDDEYCGDVTTADFTQYKGFDLVIGGSPCTYWSIAKTNREVTPDGVGGQLFMHFVRAVRETGCKYFLYENNYSIHKDIKAFISDQLGVEPIMINSALVSAQQRKRCYWTNIPNVVQPADRGIFLKDILISADREKSLCNVATYGKKSAYDYFKRNYKNQMAIEPVSVAQRGRYRNSENRFTKSDGGTEQYYEERQDKKSNCITSVQKDSMIAEPINDSAGKSRTIKAQYACSSPANIIPNQSAHFDATGVAEPIRIGNINKGTHIQDRVYSVSGKSVTLKANGGGGGANTGLYAFSVKFDGDIPIEAKSFADGKIYSVYKVENGLIEIKEKTYPIKLKDGYYIIRKLTPVECERLQTLPDNYTEGVSNTQRYKCIGNGWTVEVIAHIFGFILNY